MRGEPLLWNEIKHRDIAFSTDWKDETRENAAPFPSDRARVKHLFALYEKLTAPLAPTATTRGKRAKV